MGPYVIGIDSGTQSTRVIVFDLHGNIVAQGSARHAPLKLLPGGGAEQDPDDLWLKLCLASRQAMSSLAVDQNQIAGASLSCQRSVTIPIGEDGCPLRPAFSWLDERRVPFNDTPASFSAADRERRVRSKANWMAENEPDLYSRVHKFLSVGGWLAYRLCGRFCDSAGILGGVYPLDVSRLSWSDDPGLYRLLGIPRAALPEILAPASLFGTVTREAASQTGLPEGLPLFSGAGDKSCEMLGAGVISPRQGYVSYGTLAAFELVSQSPIFAPDDSYWTTPGAIPGTWILEFGIECGYWMVAWFLDQFYGKEFLPEEPGVSLENELSKQAERIPAGSGGLVLAPYWSRNGLAPEAQSVLLGLNKTHSRLHMFRAILEGIAFGLLEGMEALTTDTGIQPEEIMIGGGGAQSDLSVQITADILGLPVTRMHTVETCAMGAGIEAAVGAGLFAGYPEATREMCRREKAFSPDPANRKTYDQIYTRIYRKLYPALRQVFKEYRGVFLGMEAGG